MGTLGSGKTLLTTLFCAAAHQAGMRIYTNYELYIPNERLTTVERMKQVERGLLAIDELQFILDARAFKDNVSIVHWIVLLRKLGLEFIYTSQNFGNVDLRLRQVTDWVMVCSKIKPHLGYNRTKIDVISLWPSPHRVRGLIFAHHPLLYQLYNTYDRKVLLEPERVRIKSR